MSNRKRGIRAQQFSSATGFAPRQPVDPLRLAVDTGLFAAIFVLPFVMGGRQAMGELALTVIACWTAMAWLLRQVVSGDRRLRMTAMTPLLVIGIAIGAVQCVTLTPELVQTLSPHIERVLPAWTAESTEGMLHGPWTTLSLTPIASQRSLVCVIACAMLFFVAVNRLQTLEDIRSLVRALAVAMTLMALFGSLQYLLGNGRFFWVYEHPFTNTRDYAKGAFTNPNHFADYVAMSLPLLLAWYSLHFVGERTSRSRSGLEGLAIVGCLAINSVAILLSQSRGGLLAACIGVMVCLFFLHRVRALTGRTAGMFGGIACVAAIALSLFGDRVVALVEANFHELASADVSQLDRGNSRQKIWQAATEGIRDYPLPGTGLSSHREVYWTYFDHPDQGTEFSHAENGYLQLALEAGLVGAGLAACCLLLWVGWCLLGLRRSRSIEVGALLAAILGVMAIHLAHSVTDFVWYAPAIMVVVMLLAACAASLYRLSSATQQCHEPATPSGLQLRWAPVALGCILLSGWMIQTKLPAVAAEPHWFEYIRLVQAEERLSDDVDREVHRKMKYTALLNAARADRHDARIQLRAAQAYRAMFEIQQARSANPMSLLQIQDAALASEWDSHEELTEWLNRSGVLGENRKYLDTAWTRALHALALCPLQSEGYLLLSELSWMNGISNEQETALLAQALTARPYDAGVHFAAGRVVSLRGDEAAALKHWKESFERSPRYRRQITELLSPVWPAERFVAVFEPDTDALTDVVAAYRSSPDAEGYRRIAAHLADRLTKRAAEETLTDAVRTWRQAHDLYVELGDAAGADRTAKAAVAAEPNNFQARRKLAKWLFSQEQYADAVEQLQWCLRRSPTDQELAGWLHASMNRQEQRPPREAIVPVSGTRRR